MQFTIDTWDEWLIAGITIISSLIVLYFLVRLLVKNNVKIKTKGGTIMGGKQIECSDYVKEHTQLLLEMRESLKIMESNRLEARKENSETNKVTQILIKNLLLSQDALMEAFQKNNIGNGNLERARKIIANSIEVQDKYLIDQL